MRVRRIGIFWRSDRPEGLCVEIADADEAQKTADAMQEAYAGFKASSAEAQERFLSLAPEMIANAARHKGEGGRWDELLVYGCIGVYILESEGRLDVDEYNGCIFDFVN
jgi:hypothetical protein